MASLCNNSVVFTGDPIAVENIKALFKEIQEKQEATQKWYLPPYVTADFSKMQHITVSDEKIDYQTRWLPNLAGLVQIAEHYGVKFVNQFNELEHDVFGEAGHVDGQYYDIRLEDADFEEIDVHDIAALEHALDRKIQQELYFKTTSNITKAELADIYGDLLEGDLLLKFACHKNFDKAREIFESWEEKDIIEMDRFLNGNFDHVMDIKFPINEYIALKFLRKLINEWDHSLKKSRQNYQSR